MRYHVETNALICRIKGLDETHFGGFRLHQLLPETLPLCYWNIDIFTSNKFIFYKHLLLPAVTSHF